MSKIINLNSTCYKYTTESWRNVFPLTPSYCTFLKENTNGQLQCSICDYIFSGQDTAKHYYDCHRELFDALEASKNNPSAQGALKTEVVKNQHLYYDFINRKEKKRVYKNYD